MLFSAFGWYGALIGIGMAICVILAFFMAKKRGYDTDIIFNIAIICIPLAILGARTYYVVNDIIHTGSHWSFARFCGFENGKFVGFSGLAIYGGLLGGAIGGVIVRCFNKKKPKMKQMTLVQMADLAFCLIILGQAIGRWGNFANQEAYGQLVTNPSLQWFPFAVFIDEKGQWYNACFFYESMWNLIGFGLLQWMYNGRRKSFDGFYVSFYCIWYGFIRFFVEMLRSDSMWFGPIKANMLISACIFCFGLGVIIYHIVMAKKAGKKPFFFVNESELCGDYYGYEKTFFYNKKLYEQEQAAAALVSLPEQSEEQLIGQVEEPSIGQSEEPPIGQGEEK